MPPLGYAYDALEPHIDAQTMQIHHQKHHAGYVAKLNEACAGMRFHDDSRGEVGQLLYGILSGSPLVQPRNEAYKAALLKFGGGHFNHSLFWKMLAPASRPSAPDEKLAGLIGKAFGGMEAFQKEFNAAASSVFGSGWAWLSWNDRKSKLIIETSPYQENPIMHGRQVLLGLDVWEHAYYLKHQNRRADYIAAFWKVVNWDYVNQRCREVCRP